MRRLAWILLLLSACDDGEASGDAAVAIDAPPSVDGGGEPVDAGLADAGPVELGTDTDFDTLEGTVCGLAWDASRELVFVYACMGSSLSGFEENGDAWDGIGFRGEAADDVDLTSAPAAFTLGEEAVAAGELLIVNGETGVAEIYRQADFEAVPFVTEFGGSHVVGGAYHPGRGTFFLIQDKQAAVDPSTVAEIDVATGAVRNKFATLPDYSVNYGDLEVCPTTGNLLLVSSDETTMAEFSPEGAFLAEHVLPGDVPALSGLGLKGDGTAWVSSTSGGAWRLTGVPCH
jgi:hypothetical protein